MEKEKIFYYILEQHKYPIVFVDNDHIMRFMNKAAIEKYSKRGGSSLIGKSIFDCHNERSNEMIKEYYKKMAAGENEIFLTVNKANQKVTMIAVRDDNEKLLGYYERFEDIEPK
ncbi:MAG: PAS domain-containing protein [Spirochaetales bacterium]|nr:PAS domain-containing protein [Spirochaetales bacterium]